MKSWEGWPHRFRLSNRFHRGPAPGARVFGAFAVASSGPRLDLIVRGACDCRIGSQRARDCREAGGSQDRSPSQASAQGFVPASAVGKRAEAREEMGQ